MKTTLSRSSTSSIAENLKSLLAVHFTDEGGTIHDRASESSYLHQHTLTHFTQAAVPSVKLYVLLKRYSLIPGFKRNNRGILEAYKEASADSMSVARGL